VAALTEAEINAKIANIVAELDAIIVGDGSGADSNMINYRSGDRQFNKTDRIRELRELLEYWRGELAKLPAEEVTLYDDPAL